MTAYHSRQSNAGEIMRRTLQSVMTLTALLALCPAGCDAGLARKPETGATLEGTVSYGDQKIMVGLVIVQNDKGSATAFIDDDGRYKVENVPICQRNVAVNPYAGKGQMTGRLMAQSKGKSKVLPKVVELPAKFQNPGQSGIKTTVNKGANEYDIVIPK